MPCMSSVTVLQKVVMGRTVVAVLLAVYSYTALR